MLNFKNQVSLGSVTGLDGNALDITGDFLLNSIEIHTPPPLGSFNHHSFVLTTDSSFVPINGAMLSQKQMFDNTVDVPSLDGALVVNTNEDITAPSLNVVTIGNKECNVYPLHVDGFRLYDDVGRQVFGVMSTSGNVGDLPTTTNMVMAFAVVIDGLLEVHTLPAGNYQYREQLVYSFINARYKNLSPNNDFDIGKNINDTKLRTYAKFEYTADSTLTSGEGYIPTFELTHDNSSTPKFVMRDSSNLPVTEVGTNTPGIAIKPLMDIGPAYRSEVDFYINGEKIKDELVSILFDGNDITVYANLLDVDYAGPTPENEDIFELVYYGKYVAPGPVLTILPRAVVETGNDSTVNVLNGVYDPNDLPLTVVEILAASNGTAVVSGEEVIFTPDPGFTGTAEVYYSVTNGDTTTIGVIHVDVVADASTYVAPSTAVGAPMGRIHVPTTANEDEDITATFSETVIADILANDLGEHKAIQSIDSVSGDGVASIEDGKLKYVPSPTDAGNEISIDYTIVSDTGTDTGTLNINVTTRFDATYKSVTVGNTLAFTTTGDFHVDYGDGTWVGPVTAIDQPSVGSGNVRIMSNNATKVISNDVFTEIHVDICEDITNADDMFSANTAMTTFTLGTDAFRNTTSFNGTWQNCNSLTTFPLIDITDITELKDTWNSCTSLTSFPSLDTVSIVTLENTWDNCASLTVFPLLDFSSTTKMNDAWRGCSSLTEFPLIDTASVVEMNDTWQNCTDLTSFPLLNTANVVKLDYTWENCSSLTSFPEINVDKVENNESTWRGCSSLTSFPVLAFPATASFTKTWQNCTSLTAFPLITFNSAQQFIETWDGCTSLTEFPQIDTVGVLNLDKAWRNCSSIVTFPTLNISNVTSTIETWKGCSSFVEFPQLLTGQVVNMEGTWSSCSNLKTFPSIDTGSVDNVSYVFKDCIKLRCLTDFDTTNATVKTDMFANTPLLVKPTASDITQLESPSGLNFINPDPCPPPTDVVADGTLSVAAFTAGIADILANDDGIDLTISSIDSNGGNGTAEITADNKIKYTPTLSDAGTTFDITYTIAGAFGTDTGTLTITVPEIRFDATYKTENVGDTLDFDTTGDFYVDYGDGTWVGPVTSINQPSVGTGSVRVISANASKVNCNNVITEANIVICDDIVTAGPMFKDCNKLTSFTVGTNAFRNATKLESTWENCTSLTSFPVMNTDSLVDVDSAWENCNHLTTFPTLDLSNVTDLQDSWRSCIRMTSFPLINISSVSSIDRAWENCTHLTEFPFLNTANVTTMNDTWQNCNEMVSFPAIDTGNVVEFDNTWKNCASLEAFPLIDLTSTDRLFHTWDNCRTLESFPSLNTGTATIMIGTFMNCKKLKCIGGLNTTNATDKTDLFTNTPKLQFPMSFERMDLTSPAGYDYVNPNPCPMPTETVEDDELNMDIMTTETVDVLANDYGSGLTLASIDSHDGNGTATITSDGKISYTSAIADNYSAVTINYTVTGSDGTDTGTLVVNVASSFDAHYKINIGDSTNFTTTGNFYVDYGDGTWVGPTGSINQPSTGTGIVKVLSNNATKVVAKTTVREAHVERCDKIIDASFMFYGLLHMTKFTASPKAFRNTTDFSYTWEECKILPSFPGINTDSATNLHRTWYRCHALETFNMLDTENVTNMEKTWEQCFVLDGFPLIDTANVTTLKNAWNNCRALTTFPQIDTANVTNFDTAWYGCESLESFPLLNTDSATRTYGVFSDCVNLQCIGGFNTTYSTAKGMMFNNTPRLLHPTVSEQNSITSSSGLNYVNSNPCPMATNAIGDGTIDMGVMETKIVDVLDNDEGGSLAITSINSNDGQGTASITADGKLSYTSTIADNRTIVTIHYTVTGVNGTDNGMLVLNIGARFDATMKLDPGDSTDFGSLGDFYVDYGNGSWVGPVTSINQPATGTGRVKLLSNNSTYFRATDNVKEAHMERCDDITNADFMFYGITNMTKFTASNIAFRNVTDFTYTWEACRSLTTFPTINLSSANTLVRTWFMCEALTEFPLMDTSNVTNMTITWNSCYTLTEFPLIDTGNVTTVGGAWGNCTGLITFPQINTANVTDFDHGWHNCTSMIWFPLLDTSSATSTNEVFKDSTSLQCIGGFDTRNSTDKSGMFTNTPHLVHPNASEQAQLVSSGGTNYINATQCPIATKVIDDGVIDLDLFTSVILDVLNNDEGSLLTLDSIDSHNGNGTASITADGMIKYDSVFEDNKHTVNINYTISGLNGTDTGTLSIYVIARFDGSYKIDVGDATNFATTGDFYVDYGNGTWVGPTTSIDQPSTGSGIVRIMSNNASKVQSGSTVREAHIEKCDDIRNANYMFVDNNQMTKFTVGPQAFRKTISLHATWQNCTELPSFPHIEFPNARYSTYTWFNCRAFTSFPHFETNHLTDFTCTWGYCVNLTSFPTLDFSNTVSISNTWKFCINLLEFPQINTPLVSNFDYAWFSCWSFTSFPLLNTDSCNTSIGTFKDCTDLVCIGGFNTTGSNDKTYFMTNTPSLVHPNSSEQAALVSSAGSNYVNSNPCP